MPHPTATHTLGLELLLKEIVAVEAVEKKDGIHIQAFYQIPLSGPAADNDHVKPLDTDSFPKELKNALAKELSITALPAEDVLVRSLSTPLKKEKEIEEVIAFQAEPLLPFPPEETLVDFIKVKEDKDGSELTLSATRTSHLEKLLAEWKYYQVDPEVVTSEQAALASFAAVVHPSDQPFITISVGQKRTICALVRGKKLIAAQTIPIGVDSLKMALGHCLSASVDSLTSTTLYHYEWHEVQENDDPLLFQAIDSLRLDIARTSYSLCKYIKTEELQGFLWAGEGACWPHLIKALEKNLAKRSQDKPLEITELPGTSKENLLRYALAFGSAFSSLESSKNTFNFRKNQFSYPTPWRRYQSSLFTYTGAALLLAAALYFGGSQYVNKEEDRVRQDYVALLKEVGKPFKEFEEEFAQKSGTTEVLVSEDAKELSLIEIEERLDFLENELNASPDIFPLWPNTPRVSDLLAWLATHPNIAPATDDGKQSPLLTIESLHYSMVKRPDFSKKSEHYQIKVELELSTPTPKYAREFHDALIAPNDFVDPKGEVKWSSSKGRYKTSFFLKDKTAYPSFSQ